MTVTFRSDRALAALLVGAGAVVPCIFFTGWDDVFYLPKLVALWVVLAVALWLLVLGAVLRDSRLRLRFVPAVDVPLAAFLVLNFLAYLFSTDRSQSLFGERLQHQGLLTLALYVSFFVVARLAITDIRRLLLVFAGISLGATVVSGYAIVQRLGWDPVWKGYLPAGRVFSTIGQPNALAAYLVVSGSVTLVLLAEHRGRLRVALTVAVLMMASALVLTYSRGGYLGAGAALAVGALVWLRRSDPAARPYGTAVAAMTAAVGLCGALLLVPAARTQVTQALHRVQSVAQLNRDISIGNHFDQWKVALRIVEDHPLLGTGPETYPEVFPRDSRMVLSPADVRYFDQFRVESPHDEVLAVAAGSGIPAALAYLGVLVGVGYRLWRATRRTDRRTRVALAALMAVLVGHFVTDSFMSAEITGSWLFWLLLGAGVALSGGPAGGSGAFGEREHVPVGVLEPGDPVTSGADPDPEFVLGHA